MTRRLFLAAALLLLGCIQGTKVEVINQTGVDITGVDLMLGDIHLSWASIPNGGSTVTSAMLPSGGEWRLAYTSGTMTVEDSNQLPDSLDRAKSLTILISGGSTGLIYRY